jgi:transaldolase
MPETTLKAVADHGEISTLLRADGGTCEETLAQFIAAGIDLYALATRLQEEGTRSFASSWNQLMTFLASRA